MLSLLGFYRGLTWLGLFLSVSLCLLSVYSLFTLCFLSVSFCFSLLLSVSLCSSLFLSISLCLSLSPSLPCGEGYVPIEMLDVALRVPAYPSFSLIVS